MARLGKFGFLAVAVIFHLVYIYSIFDIYFVSPIVSGMTAFSVQRGINVQAPAQRVVLFVGDGLRADKAFQSFADPSPVDPDAPGALEPRPLAPYLRSCVLERGTFGVSHTRVPTESRPGHVALIAGLYEDVSSITTGWKLNPVNFDSVFNRSRHTWSWGSPDILPMFKEGAVPGRIDADTYGEEAEDFTQDATQLDIWVFEKVKELFKAASKNQTLDNALRQDKNVFFLHLLGLDTSGHAYRPYSKEYLHNIKIVDQGVQEITMLIDEFYGDSKTAYVFTADHGMTDWGSHGDGHPDNTRTPLIVWGSGVAKPIINNTGTARGHDDGFSSDWGLDHVERHDVSQADVATLMAYLAGLEFPVNSVGELPLPYLDGDSKEKAEAALVNARAILEMYRVKEEQKKAAELRYKPFQPLGDEDHSVDHRLNDVRAAIDKGEYDRAIAMSKGLLNLGIDGLRYLQTYDWLFLRALVTSGYLGWVAFAFTTVIDLHVLDGKTQTSRSFVTSTIFGALVTCFFSYLFVRKAPISFYAYALFPLVFWEEVVARRKAVLKGSRVLLQDVKSKKRLIFLAFEALAFVGLLEALVLSYFHRIIYTICFVAASSWPAFYGQEFIKKNKLLLLSWLVACLSMSTFTLLPVIKVENTLQILLGGTLMFSVGILYLQFEKAILFFFPTKGWGAGQQPSPSPTTPTRTPASSTSLSQSILGVQIGLILLAMIVTWSSIASLQAKRGLPLGNQVVGWLVLIASFAVPLLHGLQQNNHYLRRLVIIFLTFSPSFIILTISYEGLFYFVFCSTLLTWVQLEHRIHSFRTTPFHKPNKPPSPTPTPKPQPQPLTPDRGDLTTQILAKFTETTTASSVASPSSSSSSSSSKSQPICRNLNLSDMRPALFFLFLLQSAFFSTGNIASISSFSLESVYRLIPVFNPFSQGALLLLKLLIPFAVISANLGILTRRLRVPPSSLFMLVISFSDVLTMNFFWLVKDEGSWLGIGTSISHFVIASLLCVFVAGLEFLSEIFVAGVEVEVEVEDGIIVKKEDGKTASSRNNGGGHAKGVIVNGELKTGME